MWISKMTIMDGWSHGVLGYQSQTENIRYNFQIILSSVSDYMYLDCRTINLWHYLIYTFSGTDTEKFRIEYEWGLFKWNPFGECSWLRNKSPSNTVPQAMRQESLRTSQDSLRKELRLVLLKPHNNGRLDIFIWPESTDLLLLLERAENMEVTR
jgi:hypothetical protein